MRSPVLQNILTYIKIDKTDSSPIYLQIAQGIINAIQTKAISTTDKLPGSRTLSEKLFIHRKTAIAAYEELAAQGWIDIIPQKGAFVANKKLKIQSPVTTDRANNSSISPYTIATNFLLDSPYQNIFTDLYFTTGTPDYRLTDYKSLNQIFNALTRKKNAIKVVNKNFYADNLNLKQQLLNYIYITKKLSANSTNLLLFQNNQLTFQGIIQTVFSPNDIVVVPDIGHFEANMLFNQAKTKVLTVSLNEEGIAIDHLTQIITNNTIRALYIPTNHLYPTTNQLTLKNKSQLLDLAYQYNFILIEDDNSTDFVYSKSPLLSLKNEDKYGSVIYVNSLKQILPNPYDLGYVLAPENLIIELAKTKNLWQTASLYLIEETIAEYIKEGHLLRQLQRQTKTYQKRRDYFAQLLEQYLAQSIYYEKPENGLGYWIQFNHQVPLLSIAKYCTSKNLTIPHYLLYQTQELVGIRIGFGHLNEQEADEALALLSQAINHHLYK